MNDNEAAAVLAATLESFDGRVDLLKRDGTRRVSDIFHPSDDTNEKRRTIYRDNLDYLGQSIQIIVFRFKKAKGDPRDKSQFALFNDTTGAIQPVSIQQILRIFKMPPDGRKHETNLNNLIRNAESAQRRVKVAPLRNRS